MDLIKLQILAGQALPGSSIGPVLGQKGVNAIEFSKQFNESTSEYPENWLVSVKIYVEKRKFFFVHGDPSMSSFLKKASHLKKSSGNCIMTPQLSVRWIYELAVMKKDCDPRWKNISLLSGSKIILGTALSMHLEISS